MADYQVTWADDGASRVIDAATEVEAQAYADRLRAVSLTGLVGVLYPGQNVGAELTKPPTTTDGVELEKELRRRERGR